MARPLTKHNGTGKRYARPPNIEAQIDAVLGQDMAALRIRLGVTDRASADHLESESLVHLIRQAHRRGDQDTVGAVFPVLLKRCEAILKSHVLESTFYDAAEIRGEALGQFAERFATDGSTEDSDHLDYFECKFNAAFRTFRIDLVRRERSRLRQFASLPLSHDEPEPDAGDDSWAKVSSRFRRPANQEGTRLGKELDAAIQALPPDERDAVVLCHVLGYKIESEKPGEETAATRCGVTGRTIRTRLSRAQAKLKAFKTEALL